MATEVVMPRLSDSMEEGTILKWLVSEGDEVKRGQEIVEIETDKANMTYEADTDGALVEIVAQEGDTLPIGEVIARIGEAGEVGSGQGAVGSDEGAEAEEEPEPEPEPEEPKAETATEEREEPEPEPKREEPEPEPAPTAGDGDGRIKASPVARRMARDLGVELARLEGSGPGGRIVKADVEAAAKGDGAPAEPAVKEEVPQRPRAEPGAKGEAEVHELTRLQQTVSRRMAESKATAPDFALTLDVDMTLAVELRQRLKDISDPAPSYNDMVVKAAAAALREHPRVNGAYRDGKWELYPAINVGVAVAAEEALVVPTIFGADRKSLGEIAREARGLIGKVRDRKITPPEVSGGTFTVSNLGMYGIREFTAIINPPQAALLTVGSLEKRPAVDERGRVVARDQMTLTLVCDHRILYGADGAQFLARVRELLEQPLALAL
jgi:pyruvate dehydrogenase E2 component (dihydrolipoyllysine-residue acetyltransferase)